jgi:hypothetical protein
VAIAQVLGGLAAAGLVAGLFPGPLKVATSLRPGTSVAQGLFIEVFLTAELVFVIIMLAAEKHRSTHMAPVGIGIAFFVTQLTGLLPSIFLPGALLHDIAILILLFRCSPNRRISQPGAQFWSGGGDRSLSRLPLDLLGWALAGRPAGRWVLCLA